MFKQTIWEICAVLMVLLTAAFLVFAVNCYFEFVFTRTERPPGMGADDSFFINPIEQIESCGRPCPYGIKVGQTTRPEVNSLLPQQFCSAGVMSVGRCTFKNDQGCYSWGAHSETTCIAIEYKNNVVSKFTIEGNAIIQRLKYGGPIGIRNISETTSAIWFAGGVSAEFDRSETIAPTLESTKLVYLDPQTAVPDLQPWPGWYVTQTDKLIEILTVCIIGCWLALYAAHRRLFVRKRKMKKRFVTSEPSKEFGENPPVIS